MMEFLASTGFQNYILYAMVAVIAAGLVATVTPTQIDNKFANYALKAINLLGGNFWKASNGDVMQKQHDVLVKYARELEASLEKKEDPS